jgi:methionyl-tRNA formyltransferase
MRFCVFLSGERGISTVTHLIRNKLPPTEVYLDKGNGAIRERASKLFGKLVNIEEVENVNHPEFVSYLESLKLDFGIVAGFSTIFKSELLRACTYGMINQHAGRLPAYRGGSPLNWQIINGEPSIGISVIKMDHNIDSGKVLATAEFSLSDEEDIADAHLKANEFFGPITMQAIDRLLSDRYAPVKPGCGSVYWHQRNDSDGLISWDRLTAIEVVNLVRGVAPPYPGAFSFTSKGMVRVYRACVPSTVYKGSPGRVFFVQGEGPLVCARDRAVLLQSYSLFTGNGRETKLEVDTLKTGDYLTRQIYI